MSADATQQLIVAVASEDTDEIHNQLNAGADINVRDANGYTLLQNAIRGYKNEAVFVLLGRGADAELPTASNPSYTALHVAAQCANEVAAKLLLQYCTEPDVLDGDKETPLHVAAAAGALAVARLLIEAGAEVMPLDKNRETPRDVATRAAAAETGLQPHVETARYLEGVEKERGIDRETEQARRALVASDVAKLKSLHPERYKIKTRLSS
jgi:ankyrin repeat protein